MQLKPLIRPPALLIDKHSDAVRRSHLLPFMVVTRYNRAPFAPVRPLNWTKIRDLHR